MNDRLAREGRYASRRRVIGAVAAAGSCLVIGSAEKQPGTVVAAAQTAGTPGAATGIGRAGMPAWSFTVLTFQDPYAGEVQQPAQPPANTRYLAAEVVLENASQQALDFTPADVRLRDASGREFRGGTAVGTEPFIAPRNLNGGERSRGWVWFTVPTSAQIVQVVYVAPPAELRIPLADAG